MRTLAILTLLVSAPLASAQCEGQLLTDPGGGMADWFGYVLSLEGDLALVSSNRDETPGMGRGSVFVYEREGRRWVLRQRLNPPSGVSNSVFGKSTAIDGERLLIGAYNHIGANSGPAYVFERQSSGRWAMTAMLMNPSPATFDVYSVAVDLQGERAFTCTPKESSVLFEAGALDEWTLGPMGWTPTESIVPRDPEQGARFGSAVRVDGGVLAVSAWWAGPFQEGAVYLFEEHGDRWEEVMKLTGDALGAFDEFGRGLSLEGQRLAVGSPEGGAGPGSVYVYERDAEGWIRTAKLRASDGEANDNFGEQVQLRGNRLLVGALRDDDAASNAGAAYVFDLVDGEWLEVAKLVSAFGQTEGRGGEGIGLGEEGILVAWPWNDASHGEHAGEVAAFELPAAVQPGCFGVGCPCGVDHAQAGCPGSLGVGARLTSCGTTRVSRDDLELLATDLPPSQFGVLCMADGSRAVPLGAGIGCLGGGTLGVFRFPVQAVDRSGQLAAGPGLVEASDSLGSGAIQPGQTWNFQVWYRDPAGSCASHNLTHSLSVEFRP